MKDWILQHLSPGPASIVGFLNYSIACGNNESAHRDAVLELMDEGKIRWRADRKLEVVSE